MYGQFKVKTIADTAVHVISPRILKESWRAIMIGNTSKSNAML